MFEIYINKNKIKCKRRYSQATIFIITKRRSKNIDSRANYPLNYGMNEVRMYVQSSTIHMLTIPNPPEEEKKGRKENPFLSKKNSMLGNYGTIALEDWYLVLHMLHPQWNVYTELCQGFLMVVNRSYDAPIETKMQTK